MRILIDTNIVIPMEDFGIEFDRKLAELSRLSSGKHEILVHPASLEDISRDKDEKRRSSMRQRLEKYNQLESPPILDDETQEELFGRPPKANHNVDNRILFSIYKDCVHWLVTQDVGIHRKARRLGISERVLLLEQVIPALKRIEAESINLFPHIEDVLCHSIDLQDPLFDSLREGYLGFDKWFKEKCCQTGRHAWIYSEGGALGAICIYKVENDPRVTSDNRSLQGKVLKLCTFKVTRLGYKIGELLLKQAFSYAQENDINYIYVTVDPENYQLLHNLFIDFGFSSYGCDTKGRDEVYVKNCPSSPPASEIGSLDYAIKYYPMFKLANNSAYFVPIKPQYHEILFPELKPQIELFDTVNSSAGNAIKQAYLCNTPNKSIKPGDLLFFYRTTDEKSVTSFGIVDQFHIESDIEKIYQWVSKRTVYTYDDIKSMVVDGNEVKVILFRLLGHLKIKVPYSRLKSRQIVNGSIQSIISIKTDNVKKILREANCNDCFIPN